jgi:hypothetical protein
MKNEKDFAARTCRILYEQVAKGVGSNMERISRNAIVGE